MFDGKGNDLVDPLRAQERIGQIDLDLPISDTLTTTPTITATQTMSGSLWSWGPGPFEYRLGYTHTFTSSLDLEGPPFEGNPPLGDPGSTEHPANLGPGESPVGEPAGNSVTTGGQKKGNK